MITVLKIMKIVPIGRPMEVLDDILRKELKHREADEQIASNCAA